MRTKTLKFLAIAALTTVSSYNANAAENYEPFVGVDVGTRLNSLGGSATEYGIKGGLTLGQAHQLSVGYNTRSDDFYNININTIYSQYDYLVPITQNLTWNIGGKLGYEKSSESQINGVVLGAQTGINYRLSNWSIGSDLGYLHHTGGTDSAEMDAEFMLMGHLKYHF